MYLASVLLVLSWSVVMFTKRLSVAKFSPQENDRSAFIAVPMSGFSSDLEYQESRKTALNLAEHLKKKHTFSDVYYAGSEIPSQSNFTSHNLAMKLDLEALRKADIFVLLYPARLVSSVLIEAGYALALAKPMLIMAKNLKDLPYFFHEVKQISDDPDIPFTIIHEYQNDEDVLRISDNSVPQLLHRLIV